MSTFTREALKKRLSANAPSQRLVVTPILDPKQISAASIDVRLGNQFIVFQHHALSAFQPRDKRQNIHRIQRRHIIPFGRHFVLHPGMLVLAATFEYVAIPGDIECQVEGRSSWARVGLQIATATTVEPLFKGVITLELSNVGATPLELSPGVRIAQLLFRLAVPTFREEEANRKYQYSIGPEFTRLHRDLDLDIFGPLGAFDKRVSSTAVESPID